MEQVTKVDVLVAGGGPAGIGAAIAASRAGAKTLLVERHGFLGGVGAHGMGMGINQMRPGGRPRSTVHELVIERTLAYGPEAGSIADHALVCNVEYLKAALIDALDSVACSYLLHCRLADAVVADGQLRQAVVATKQGLTRIKAKTFVDATGDADLAYLAGAETLKGRETDGFLSPMTLCFIISQVDVDGAQAYSKADGGCRKLIERARSKYPLLPETIHFERRLPLKDSLVVNHAGTKLHGSLDASDPAELTEAERYSRHQIIQITQALREFGGAAFANVQLAAAGAQVGVRETRRLKGLYQLTEQDAMAGRRFDDAVAWRSGYLDIGFVRWEPMKVHDVPYRALIPGKLDGLRRAATPSEARGRRRQNRA
ncbi:MAG: FAD-dependent oxidoreductase [Armatimonadota bacterium]